MYMPCTPGPFTQMIDPIKIYTRLSHQDAAQQGGDWTLRSASGRFFAPLLGSDSPNDLDAWNAWDGGRKTRSVYGK